MSSSFGKNLLIAFYFTSSSPHLQYRQNRNFQKQQPFRAEGARTPTACSVSDFELSASHLCFSSVQFTKNHVCKAYLAAKRVQSSHGIQNLASNSEKDYTVAFGEIILAARLELALLKQLSALPSFPHRNCKSLNGITQSCFTLWKFLGFWL